MADRTVNVMLRLTPQEHEKVVAAMQAEGSGSWYWRPRLAQWIRMTLLKSLPASARAAATGKKAKR